MRIALAHNGETRYILTDVTIDSEKEFKNGIVVRRPDAAIINIKLRGIVQKYQETIFSIDFIDSMSCAEVVSLLKSGKDNQPKNMDGIFEEMIINPRVKGSSKKTYRNQWNILSQAVGSKMPQHINYSTLMLVEQMLIKRGVKKSTIRIYMTTLRMVINYAVKCGYVTYGVHPFAKYSMPKMAIRDSWLTLDQIKTIRDCNLKSRANCLDYVRDIFMLSFYLGGINYIDLFKIDFVKCEGLITYWRSKVENRCESDEPVSFKIPEEALPIIERLLGPDGKVTLPCGQTYINRGGFIHRNMRVLSERLGIPNLIYYSARKTFAQQAYELGINSQIIDHILGHSIKKSESSIRHYVYVTPEMATEAIRKVLDCLK